ncbi:hypothetical protein [Sphingomonas sp. Leaf67]|uniref:hypothetical protein n=1 Tax=Sphingomonas sp. Leaf67 TaxID=1736230 RepID=UPI000A766674|nr:hypothetical protein [Sphingomonas sp. Leaf67]
MIGSAILGAMLLATPTSSGAPRCPVTNLMPQYWALQAKAAPFRDYKTILADKNPALYTGDFVNALRGDHFTAWEQEEQTFLSKNPFAARSVSRVIVEEMPHYIDDFTRAFPKLTCNFTIYVAPSFGTMNAAAMRTPDGLALVFSPVTILRYDGDRLSQFKLLFDHELFHIYHAQASRGAFGASADGNEPLYATLWSEGLAVHVSEGLNGDIGRDRSLMDLTLQARSRPLRQQIARAVLADLDSRDPAVSNRYFALGVKGGAFPPRSGYYIGALVADDLARTRTPDQLAALPDREAHALVRSSLERIATARE